MFLNLHWGFQMNVHFNMNSIKMFEKKLYKLTPRNFITGLNSVQSSIVASKPWEKGDFRVVEF